MTKTQSKTFECIYIKWKYICHLHSTDCTEKLNQHKVKSQMYWAVFKVYWNCWSLLRSFSVLNLEYYFAHNHILSVMTYHPMANGRVGLFLRRRPEKQGEKYQRQQWLNVKLFIQLSWTIIGPETLYVLLSVFSPQRSKCVRQDFIVGCFLILHRPNRCADERKSL